MILNLHHAIALASWLIFLASLRASIGKAEGEFVQLLDALSVNRRLHVSSEIVQAGVRVSVEEFLDLDNLSQLVQIKWFNESVVGQERDPRGIGQMNKLNIVLLNNKTGHYMYLYEPYKCKMVRFEAAETETEWLPLTSSSGSRKDTQASLIASLTSLAYNSPYLTQIHKAQGAAGQAHAWLLGVSGLWAKAQFNEHHPEPVGPHSAAWRVKFGELAIDYFLESLMLASGEVLPPGRGEAPIEMDAARPTSQKYEAPSLIEINHLALKETVQLINVFQVEFNFPNQLAKSLFKLPIGFNCPANPFHDQNKLYLSSRTSQLIKIEIVANKFAELGSSSSSSETDIKNVEMVRVRHPLDANSRLTMFHSREDRTKSVFDFRYNLEHLIHFEGPNRRCVTQRLKLDGGSSKEAAMELHLIKPNLLRFNNGILLNLNQYNLDYLLNLDHDERPGAFENARLLNVFELDETRNEVIFEHELAEAQKELLMFAKPVERLQLTVVRVYGQQVIESRGGQGVARYPRGSLDLKRVLILVFNADRSQKLAEVRFNLLTEIGQAVSLPHLAKLFDLSECFDPNEQIMQLVATYPAEPTLLEHIKEHGQELIGNFYSSAQPSGLGLTVAEEAVGEDVLAKQRLWSSLNYLRVPRAELLSSPSGELELHLTILDKVSPLLVFDRLMGELEQEEGEEGVNMLMLGSLEECANHCHLYGCKVFSFNTPRRQCRLSQLPLDTSERASDLLGGSAGGGGGTVRLKRELSSQVYFEPNGKPGSERYEEATLAELGAYLEHFSSDLQSYLELSSDKPVQEDDGESNVRARRQAVARDAAQRPLFAFSFVDRSNLESQYQPPQARLLVPSALRTVHSPLTVDVSQGGGADRALRSFRPQEQVNRAYRLDLLDSSKTQPLNELQTGDERTFVNQAEKVYYTLRLVSPVGYENCALLCYNIDEWDAQTSSEQVCISFSHSKLADECVLVVRTDFSFPDSPTEESSLPEIKSLEQLQVESPNDVVALRNYLPQYNGPIRLEGGAHGFQTTGLHEDLGLQLQWIRGFEQDSAKADVGIVRREQCAAGCTNYNKLNKRACVAIDFCLTSMITRQPPAESRQRQTKNMCELLLVDVSPELSKAEGIRRIGALLERLASQTSGMVDRESLKPPGSLSDQNEAILSHTCNRYMVSHLHAFSHLNQRRLAGAASKWQLSKMAETFERIDLDKCALECHFRGSQCILFEFCATVDGEQKRPGGSASLSCTLYQLDKTKSTSNVTEAGRARANVAVSGELLTAYSKDCHVYLRLEFDSIEQAIETQTADSANVNEQRKFITKEFQHVRLSICFAIAYFCASIVALIYILHQRKPSKPTGATIPMQQVDIKSLAR